MKRKYSPTNMDLPNRKTNGTQPISNEIDGFRCSDCPRFWTWEKQRIALASENSLNMASRSGLNAVIQSGDQAKSFFTSNSFSRHIEKEPFKHGAQCK